MAHRDCIVIGASAGGVEALQILVSALPENLRAAVLVVLHTSPASDDLLPGILSKAGPLPAVKVEDRTPLEPGRIYSAPPDFHLLVSEDHLHLSRGPRENLSRPSIDALFRSAARALGSRVVGVILTGGLNDGTAGLLDIKRRGGIAVVQDPGDAVYPSMPDSACRYVQVDQVLPLRAIAPYLAHLVEEEIEAPAEPPDPIPLRMEVESRFADQELGNMEDMNRIGSPAGYSCPECHGPLWKLYGEPLLRFRCHVGHGYTAETMELAQSEASEAILWDFVRTLEERSSLIREMETRARDKGWVQEAAAWKEKARLLDDELGSVRKLLTQGGAMKPGKEPAPRSSIHHPAEAN